MHGIKETERKPEVELSSTEETTPKEQVISSALILLLHRQHPFSTDYYIRVCERDSVTEINTAPSDKKKKTFMTGVNAPVHTHLD